jgi:hypothetical protein
MLSWPHPPPPPTDGQEASCLLPYTFPYKYLRRTSLLATGVGNWPGGLAFTF